MKLVEYEVGGGMGCGFKREGFVYGRKKEPGCEIAELSGVRVSTLYW